MASERRRTISRPLVRTLVVVLSIAVLVALGLLAYHSIGLLAAMLALVPRA
jgi:hypothetical protein